MIDATISFFPQKEYDVPWRNIHGTPATWTCAIAQSRNESNGDFIPFEYFATRDPLLTCEVHGLSWEEVSWKKGIDNVYKHTIYNTDRHKDLAEAIVSTTEFMKDLKQFITLWTKHYSPARFHSRIEIEDGKVSFAKGIGLTVF
jgi:hypothetical protein